MTGFDRKLNLALSSTTNMSNYGDKRRRTDGDFAYVAPSTSRTAARARAQAEAQRLAIHQQRKDDNLPTQPLVSEMT